MVAGAHPGIRCHKNLIEIKQLGKLRCHLKSAAFFLHYCTIYMNVLSELSVHWPAKGGGDAPRCQVSQRLDRGKTTGKASKHCGPRCDVNDNHRKTEYAIAICSSVGGKIV